MAQTELFVKMITDAWFASVKRTDELFSSLSDEQLLSEVSPARNNGIYLLGHLAAVHDRMMILLGLGEPLYPELFAPFVEESFKAGFITPSASDLRTSLRRVNNTLEEHFNKMTTGQWLEKHSAVSAEDFAKEPHRNKLNIIISRTNHLEYHRGQLVFLKS